ncbi:hypothetical protein JCM19992_13560 [Thermostilla marina]
MIPASPKKIACTSRRFFGWSPSIIRRSVLAVAFIVAAAAISDVTGAEFSRQFHAWARFEPGAWKIVRTVTETFQQPRKVISVTETKTTLDKVEDDTVTLRVEVVVRVAGKRFSAEPQLIVQGFHGERADQSATITELPPANIVIQGREIPCQVLQLTLTGTTHKTVSKIFLNKEIEPFILRRETLKTDLTGNTVLNRTTVEVTALDVPCRIAGEILNTAHATVTEVFPKGKSVTRTVMSMEVPGGVVCQTTREEDREGNLIRRSSLELVDYGLHPESRRGWLFRRHLFPRRVYSLPTPSDSEL